MPPISPIKVTVCAVMNLHVRGRAINLVEEVKCFGTFPFSGVPKSKIVTNGIDP